MLAAVFGDLALVPWQRPFQVPTPKVLGTWRAALGAAPLARLQALVLAAVGGEHRDHDYRAVRVGELRLGSIDGSVTRVPDTPACRRAFGGLAPPMTPGPIRRSVTCWPARPPGPRWRWPGGPSGGPKAEGEQRAADAQITRVPGGIHSPTGSGPDRNFPGADRIARMLATGHPRADPGQERPRPAP